MASSKQEIGRRTSSSSSSSSPTMTVSSDSEKRAQRRTTDSVMDTGDGVSSAKLALCITPSAVTLQSS